MKKKSTLIAFILLTANLMFCSKKHPPKTSTVNSSSNQIKKRNDQQTPVRQKVIELCSLERLKPEYSGDFKPHTIVKQDINMDGRKDIFFLYGEEGEFNTCIYFKEKNGDYKLIHSNQTSYDSVFSFSGQEGLQLLVPGPDELNCGIIDGTLPNVGESIKLKIKAKYIEWTKRSEKFNFTYNMPDLSPIFNLAIFSKAEIYSFNNFEKKNITKQVTAYKTFKDQILKEIMEDKGLSQDCKDSIKNVFNLK